MFDGDIRLLTRIVLAILALAFCAPASRVQAEAVVGKVTQVTGKAQVKRANNSLDAVPAMPVELHDQLKTAIPGELTVEMLDNSMLTLNESSLLTIDESILSGGVRASTNVELLSGSVKSLVSAVARKAAPSFTVTTPNAIAGVRGTEFTCRYAAGKARPGFPNCFEFTDCATTAGTVLVTNNPPRPGAAVKVPAGQKTTVPCLLAPLPATPGTLGALSATASSVLGPAAVVGAGAAAAGVIGGTVAGVLETTGGGGGGAATTVTPLR
ncbi:MAG TPA: FecR family protein [Candidatus Binataceae bacterium]|jgi:hypothetical protein|nr:FecR family protein [Candidatus Binataceae bacterium]